MIVMLFMSLNGETAVQTGLVVAISLTNKDVTLSV